MKRRALFVIAIASIPQMGNAEEKLNLSCETAKFSIESNLGTPLTPGFLRSVSPVIAAFVDSDSYSTKTTIECSGKKEEKSCIGLNSHSYCEDPKNTFQITSIKANNSVLMVSNRCAGGFKKYLLTSEEGENIRKRIYMEDKMSFQIKNQIHAGVRVTSQPILELSQFEDGSFELNVEGFRSEHWLEEDPGQTLMGLKASVDNYATPASEQYTLKTRCSVDKN